MTNITIIYYWEEENFSILLFYKLVKLKSNCFNQIFYHPMPRSKKTIVLKKYIESLSYHWSTCTTLANLIHHQESELTFLFQSNLIFFKKLMATLLWNNDSIVLKFLNFFSWSEFVSSWKAFVKYFIYLSNFNENLLKFSTFHLLRHCYFLSNLRNSFYITYVLLQHLFFLS